MFEIRPHFCGRPFVYRWCLLLLKIQFIQCESERKSYDKSTTTEHDIRVFFSAFFYMNCSSMNIFCTRPQPVINTNDFVTEPKYSPETREESEIDTKIFTFILTITVISIGCLIYYLLNSAIFNFNSNKKGIEFIPFHLNERVILNWETASKSVQL